METANEIFRGHALQMSAESQICAIETQFSARGLLHAVQNDTAMQEKRENETRASEPLYYRLSELSEGAINGRYRIGKEVMEAEDLVTYFADTRTIRTECADFSCDIPSDESVYAGEAEKSCNLVVRGEDLPSFTEKLKAVPAQIRALPRLALHTVRTSYSDWFNFKPVDTTRNTHRFPVSAFAAIIAVAISLMLIVVSSVMVHQGESQLNSLSLELSELADEVNEIQTDLNVKTNLLRVREVAVKEYGMVDEKFAHAEYLTLGSEDSIEVFETERESGIGLGALLSAIGIR